MASPSLSSDEGEIIENGVDDLKATTLPDIHGNGVDRQNRNRGRHSRSPGSDHSRSRGNQSYRSGSPRGHKRPRDERDSYSRSGRGGTDPRQFRVHYEDAPREDYRSRHYEDDRNAPRSRGSSRRYEDLDHSAPRGSDSRYDAQDRDQNRYAEKRPRTRSRSPYQSSRGDRGRRNRGMREPDRSDRRYNGEQAESIQYSAQHDRDPRGDKTSKRAPVAKTVDVSKGIAKSPKGVTVDRSTKGNSKPSQEEQPGPSKEAGSAPQQDWEETAPVDEEEEIRRRRQRREEILRKSRASTPLHLLSLHADKTAVSTPGDSSQMATPQRTQVNTPRSASPPMSPAVVGDGMSPAPLDLANDQDLINIHGAEKVGGNEEDGPSAADYDPTLDMQEDERRDELRHGIVGLHGEERRESLVAPPEEQLSAKDHSEGKPADDDGDFDMFAEDFDEDKYVAPKSASKAAVDEMPGKLVQPNGGAILEGDDKDGYYKIRPGEILNGRYQIQSSLGKGMFSGVARAVDITNKRLVAIKIMRNNDALRKGGFTEIAILQKLNGADPDNRKHIVKFERSFEYKGHLCMAFENLSLNLREVLKKFGNNVGINIKGVRVYAHQIFLALAHMRKCSVIHADLKPDNILVNENRNMLKICDLGTAIDRSDAATAHNEITPYLISRFYRAPEIILGIPYDYAVDTWSIGCTLYEMYTGKILFAGDSNNQMLKAIMEIRGKMSGKLYRRGELWRMHFDELGNFVSQERDKLLGKAVVKTLAVIKPTRDLRTRLTAASSGMSDVEAKELNLFYDLLDRCLNVNPDKRITPLEALKHPFLTSRVHPPSGR